MSRQIPVPSIMDNTPTHRYFPWNWLTKTYEMSSYNPNFMKGKITIEEVQDFLAKLIARDNEFSKVGCCCGDYEKVAKELEEFKKR